MGRVGAGRSGYPTVTVCGAVFQTASPQSCTPHGRVSSPTSGPSSNPTYATPASLTRTRFGPIPGSLATTTGILLLPPATEMFQFTRFPPSLTVSTQGGGVAPFGDRGISACTRLPHAYRRVATSFIGTERQGIHRLLILSSLSNKLRSDHKGLDVFVNLNELCCTCKGTPPARLSGTGPNGAALRSPLLAGCPHP